MTTLNTAQFVQLKSKLLNQPLMVEPSYAQVLLGAIGERFNISSLNDGDTKLSLDDLKISASMFDDDRQNRKPYQVINGTAMIAVSGSLVAKNNMLRPYSGMTGYDGIKVNLDMALADEDVSKIVFDMDSGGGEVTGVFELADYIYGKRGNKPMTALVGNVSASACYILAAACDSIEMSEVAKVGSIGVVMMHVNQEKALKDKGIEVTFIHAGKHKVDGNPYTALPKEVEKRLQADTDTIRSMFVERVALYRKMSVESIMDTEALCYLGKQALDVGLCDKVVSNIDFIEKLSHTSGVNFNLENDMTKDEHDNALATAVTTATAAGVKTGMADGGVAMQARIKGILTHANAEGRGTMANHLAFNTTMDVEAAGEMLEVSAKEQPAVVVKAEAESETVIPAKSAATKLAADFDSAVTLASAEEAGIDDDTGNAPITAESNPAAFALQSFKQLNG